MNDANDLQDRDRGELDGPGAKDRARRALNAPLPDVTVPRSICSTVLCVSQCSLRAIGAVSVPRAKVSVNVACTASRQPTIPKGHPSGYLCVGCPLGFGEQKSAYGER
jgi:hypothetical protein